MLDNETKRRIDTARDVLVGKVPDPKSQVEQITIALIYKFMDDMDKEAVAMGGKASFFTGDYQKYAWSKIFAPQLGGFEMLSLYADAITRMSQNPNIPQLFLNIFKNAYLPYRDPETLKLFLKTINEFSYDHSERLGDAFEYLLSVLGSQGDAGQFRTPRHIIDFMVQVVDPKKNETILDPACGTAGFLISAYKHIVRANTSVKHRSENGNNLGDLLKTDERKKLLSNFKGYDISPDMVRLSLVNLYLHGFVQPQILEYDTLTSEERWNEYADVIMANPPFMSPKGGIKPHKKFSVPSNRSEVLFVDYIAEHLRPTGRAAVIVPEGIIFQSAGAYKQLRKMLVENHLYAVVSLPAGIFNPYSGVKTSILFLDRQLAKKTDSILFLKIANDGFGLGAQRREQTGSDLPDAANVLADYAKAVRSGSLEAFQKETKPCCALLVKKETLAESGEYNLTGERYRVIKSSAHKKWPMVKLGVVASLEYGLTASAEEAGDVRFIRITDINENGLLSVNDPKYLSLNEKTEPYLLSEGDLLVARTGATYGKTLYFDEKEKAVFASYLIRIRFFEEKVLTKYYWAFTRSEKYWDQAQSLMSGGGQPQFNGNALKNISFPLPPLEVQREIVAEIEGYQKLIDGARQVVENWKPQIEIDPSWPMAKLGETNVSIVDGDRGENYPKKEDFTPQGYCLFLNTSNVRNGQFNFDELQFVSKEKDDKLRKGKLSRNDIVLTTRGTIGNIALYNDDVPYDNVRINSGMIILRVDKHVFDSTFILQLFLSNVMINQINRILSGSAQPQLPIRSIVDLVIPIPPLEVQHEIVAKIEAERKVFDGCRELIALYEAKIKKVIDKVWEE